MKLVYRRSSAATALAEPTEAYAPEPVVPEPTPAPVGALQRVPARRKTMAADTVTADRRAKGPAARGLDSTRGVRAEPAGAGAGVSGLGSVGATEEEYVPQRGSYGMRLRGGMPRSMAGRILLASVVVLFLGFVTLTVAEIRRFLLHDPRFTVTTASAITVEGNEHISRGDVLNVFGSDLERNIFMVPLAERRADLERLPWVAHATVERLLPNRVRVEIQERTPIAFVRQGSHIGLVDASGVLLDMPPESAGDPHYSFPVLTGLAPDDTPEQRTARMDVYRRFMADLDSGGQHRTQALSEVDVTNPEDVKALVTLNGADILVHFGDENFLRRFEAYQRHLPEWRTQYPKLASVDMRYERQVVLEMQGGATPAPAISASAAAMPPVTAPVAEVHRAPVAAKHAVSGHSAANDRIFRQLAAHRATGRR